MNIRVNGGELSYVRRLLYEIDGYKTIISVLANCDCQNEWHDQKYEEACSMLEQLNAEYKIAIDEIKLKYIPSEYMSDKYYITINYRNNELIIKECDSCASPS